MNAVIRCVCLFFLVLTEVQEAAGQGELSPELPGILDLTQAKSPDEIQALFYDYIWKSFIAISWPNEELELSGDGKRIIAGTRGTPDTSKSILDQTGNTADGMAFAVWETYKEPEEVFLYPDQWKNYPDWNSPRPLPAKLVQTGNDPMRYRELFRYSKNFGEYATDINQPYFFDAATGPLVDWRGNYVRYEVAINRSFFEYIKYHKYYDASTQIAAVEETIKHVPTPEQRRDPSAPRPGFKRPPYGGESYLQPDDPGMIDVKAAWRVLEEEDHHDRYLHRRIVRNDAGGSHLMGLVALHILRYTHIKSLHPKTGEPKTKRGYVAATFEQVDNVAIKKPGGNPPKHPTFNLGHDGDPIQNEFGFKGSIPQIIKPPDNENPPKLNLIPIFRARSQTLSPAINDLNRDYQDKLAPSVYQYYELIGTQNKHPGYTIYQPIPSDSSNVFEGLDLNGHQGPTTGVYTNTNNLVNTALESYTQKNFSCILCHVRARPQGVPESAWEEDYFKTLTFLLNSAHKPSDKGE